MIEKFGELHQKSIMIIKMMNEKQKRYTPNTVTNVIILYGWIIQISFAVHSETNYLMVFAVFHPLLRKNSNLKTATI